MLLWGPSACDERCQERVEQINRTVSFIVSHPREVLASIIQPCVADYHRGGYARAAGCILGEAVFSGVGTKGLGRALAVGKITEETSQLARAARAADKAYLTAERERHILKLHGPGTAVANKSVFYGALDIRNLIFQTLRSDESFIVPAGGGRHAFEHRFPFNIGVDQKGRPTNVLTVIINSRGKVITAHPGLTKARQRPGVR